MQEENNVVKKEEIGEVANIGKVVEIHIKDGKTHVITSLSKNNLLIAMSLAMLEVAKDITNTKGE